MKNPIHKLATSPFGKASLALSLVLAGTALPLQARPPTPPEVVDHVKHRVHTIINNIGRAIDRATHDHDDDDYYEEDRRYRRPRPPEYYYEPAPPPPRRQRVVPPPGDEEFEYIEPEPRRSYPPDRYYTPDYQPDREYYERNSSAERSRSAPVPNYKESDSSITKKDSSRNNAKPAPAPEPQASKTAPPSPKPATDERVEYATPVPNKSGFVYPPGMKQDAANMIDVRGMTPGQKARDPRTGKIFLVP